MTTEDDSKAYIDDEIEDNGQLRIVWLRIINKVPEKIETLLVDESLTEVAFNCSRPAYTVGRMFFLMKGKVIYSSDDRQAKMKFVPIQINTVNHSTYKEVCK